MSRKCSCCGRGITGSKCAYCQFINIIALDDAGNAAELDRAAKYRRSIAEQITDLSVVAYTYRWNDADSKLKDGRKEIRITDGKACYNEIVWTDVNFGHAPDSAKTERAIKLSYRFDGKEKSITAPLSLGNTSGLWKLGVMLDSSLAVSLYLGTPESSTVSGPFPLDLE